MEGEEGGWEECNEDKEVENVIGEGADVGEGEVQDVAPAGVKSQRKSIALEEGGEEHGAF